jgi:RNA polymerase sigma-54 factor
MALEQKLHLKLAQKLVMTPTLQQAIKLLQLSRLELEQALAQEVQANPLLEAVEDAAAEDLSSDEMVTGGGVAAETATPAEGDERSEAGAEAPGEEPPGPDAIESAPDDVAGQATAEAGDAFSEVELDALFSNYLHDAPTVASVWEEAEEGSLENSAAPEATMFDALSGQLRLLDIPAELVPVCVFVIGNLDPDGCLRQDEAELATRVGTDVGTIREAIAVVQRLDPPGIGARSLQECFRLQLERGVGGGDTDRRLLALRIVVEGFDELLHQRWDRLAQRLGASRDAIREALDVLRRLSTHPGAQLGPSDNASVEPDVMVTSTEEGWKVTLADDGLPRLRISPRYLRMLQSRSLEGEAKGYLRERMRSALWFLRSVEQRQNTILKVANAIVRRQEDFLERGIPALRPLVLRDIADDIGMHESTISRVVANKFMATPRGVFPLKFFFHSAISHAIEGDISSVVVKQRIRDLIGQEDPSRPLSDARVARQLNRLGIRIARRTVAKYREELGVPSSEQRRRALR